ncbi:hypothetical protein [Geobacter sulfurreducens]|nr:hypothetical protein [Geobacter sulfurreducens]
MSNDGTPPACLKTSKINKLNNYSYFCVLMRWFREVMASGLHRQAFCSKKSKHRADKEDDMETLYTMMVVLTTVVSAVMIPRIMLDWLRYQEFLRDRNDEELKMLIAGHKGWIIRHGLCALGAVALVTCIKCLPELARYDELAGVTAAYGMMTLAFAFVESLLAQRIESSLQSGLVPVSTDSQFEQ